MEIVIESGVPILRMDKPCGPLFTALRKLEVGQSFVVDTTMRSRVHAKAKSIGIKVATRAISGGKLRIWRIA